MLTLRSPTSMAATASAEKAGVMSLGCWWCARWRTAAVIVVTFAGMLAAAPAATARFTQHAVFSRHGSNGYYISVDASPTPRSVIPDRQSGVARRHHGEVTVTVHRRAASSAYSAPAWVTRKRVKARLGEFGGMALRFHHHRGFRASSQPRSGVCIELDLITPGTFKGRFHFRGEHGYTWARGQNIRGSLESRDGPHCSGRDHGTRLTATSGSTRFFAERPRKFQTTAFVASTRERTGRVLIKRSAAQFAGPSEFTFNGGLSSAQVEPVGPPFSGSADFAAPGGWSGPLSVSFPGQPDVPLTGAGFTARLKRF
jgi:hypothetical protein